MRPILTIILLLTLQLAYNIHLQEQLTFLRAWNVVKKLRADDFDLRLKRLEHSP